jgi:acyl-CoA synthetase (AMP-forming)/AMP-acid ligase II
VVGAPDAEKGEIVVAFIVAETGREVDPSTIAAYCRGVASSYKVPDKIVIRAALPTTSTGKLMRKDLREAAAGLAKAPS